MSHHKSCLRPACLLTVSQEFTRQNVIVAFKTPFPHETGNTATPNLDTSIFEQPFKHDLLSEGGSSGYA